MAKFFFCFSYVNVAARTCNFVDSAFLVLVYVTYRRKPTYISTYVAFIGYKIMLASSISTY